MIMLFLTQMSRASEPLVTPGLWQNLRPARTLQASLEPLGRCERLTGAVMMALTEYNTQAGFGATGGTKVEDGTILQRGWVDIARLEGLAIEPEASARLAAFISVEGVVEFRWLPAGVLCGRILVNNLVATANCVDLLWRGEKPDLIDVKLCQ